VDKSKELLNTLYDKVLEQEIQRDEVSDVSSKRKFREK
jgi:hypothetical protein